MVVTLPPYYCKFNLIELIWAGLKTSISKSYKHYKFSEVINLINIILTTSEETCRPVVFSMVLTLKTRTVNELVISLDGTAATKMKANFKSRQFVHINTCFRITTVS